MTATEDSHLAPWIYGIIHGEPTPSGGFLRSLADAAVRADPQMYAILRPALALIREQFPKYACTCQEWKS
jgi:hypothetical protein